MCIKTIILVIIEEVNKREKPTDLNEGMANLDVSVAVATRIVSDPANEPRKSRTTAKEGVSSRWASRAEMSTRAHMRNTSSCNDINISEKPESPVLVKAPPFSQGGTTICRQVHNVWLAATLPFKSNEMNNSLLVRGRKGVKHSSEIISSKRPIRTSKSSGNIHKDENANNHGASGKSKSREKSKINQERNKVLLANSITQIQLTHALCSQLQTITDGESTLYLKSVLSILPSGFDEKSAITRLVQTRKRAFLLMDLGRVIRSHALFLSVTGGFGGKSSGSKDNEWGKSKSDDLPRTHRLNRMIAGVNSIGRKRLGVGIVYIQPQFRVTKNPDLELLKLLVRLGVDLRCNTCDDIIVAMEAIRKERGERSGSGNEMKEELEGDYFGEEGMVLVDDVGKCRKPDGYLRRLFKSRLNYVYDDSSHEKRLNIVEVGVDDISEIHRISNAIRRMSSRAVKYSSYSISTECRFIYRLPLRKETHLHLDEWKGVILRMHQAAADVEGELVGISVDLHEWGQSLALQRNEKAEDPNKILRKICSQLRLFRILSLIVGQYCTRIDLTGLPIPLTRQAGNCLTQTLSSIVAQEVSVEEVSDIQCYLKDSNINVLHSETPPQELAMISNDPSLSSLTFTADVSEHLVAKAGALCTRIIGVKSAQDVSVQSNMNVNVNDEEQASDATGMASKDENSTANASAIHYYIDDGCYGSLGCSSQAQSCSNSDTSDQEYTPLPLYGTSISIGKDESNKAGIGDAVKRNAQATVWGPTCDGLDKVCSSISLPADLSANRDWLIFPNLGCGGFCGGLGLGTAFNGFDPPDVAYCVLRYFNANDQYDLLE